MSSSSQPLEVIFAKRPATVGPMEADTFRVQPLANPPTSAPAGGVLLRLVVATVDPYMRDSVRGMEEGSQVSNWQVASVLESNRSGFSKGDLVTEVGPNSITWQTVQQHSGDGLYRLPSDVDVPVTAWAGVLGMPGRTAYWGLMDHDVGRMQPGKVVVVSSAAGTVGSLAGQLARIKGAKRVIGIAGGPDKCTHVVERYKFDACLDYKQLDTAEKMREALKKAAPEGVDIYFDNVGGHVTEAVFDVLNEHGRVAMSGAISSYDKAPEENVLPRIRNLPHMVYKALSIRGFRQFDYAPRAHEFYDELPALVASGKVVYDETVLKGLDKIPEAAVGLFAGRYTGKVVVLV